jgi:hypothetical protein
MATFNGTESGPIPLATAKEWTANYRATIKPGDTLAHYFGGDIIRKVLNESGCVGIRIYYAIDDKGQKQLLIVGADENGDNLLPAEEGTRNSNDNIIVDFSMPCPEFCASNNL